jgi:hypothetical protein
VTGCFAQLYDDCFEVKCRDSEHPCRDIQFMDSTCITVLGTPMGVTHEIAGTVEDITWKNLTVISFRGQVNRDPYANVRGAIWIHAARGGTVRNLLFENIRIERSFSKLLAVSNEPADEYTPARLENIVFRNIAAENVEDPKTTVIDGSGTGMVEKIVLDHVYINGTELIPPDERIYIKGGAEVVSAD